MVWRFSVSKCYTCVVTRTLLRHSVCGFLIFGLSLGSCSAVNSDIPPVSANVVRVWALTGLAAAVASGASDSPAVSFKKDIAPLLQRRCAACHGEESSKGGYRLDTFGR